MSGLEGAAEPSGLFSCVHLCVPGPHYALWLPAGSRYTGEARLGATSFGLGRWRFADRKDSDRGGRGPVRRCEVASRGGAEGRGRIVPPASSKGYTRRVPKRRMLRRLAGPTYRLGHGRARQTRKRLIQPRSKGLEQRSMGFNALFAIIWSPWQFLIVLGILLLLFGNRVPELMRSLGRSVTEFKKGIEEAQQDEEPKKLD